MKHGFTNCTPKDFINPNAYFAQHHSEPIGEHSELIRMNNNSVYVLYTPINQYRVYDLFSCDPTCVHNGNFYKPHGKESSFHYADFFVANQQAIADYQHFVFASDEAKRIHQPDFVNIGNSVQGWYEWTQRITQTRNNIFLASKRSDKIIKFL